MSTSGSAESPRPGDLTAVAAQLGRFPRDVVGIAHRCDCGLPDVVTTAPRLEDGTPFPTTFYLTCPRKVSAISTLESAGVMRSMEARLAADPNLRARYESAHQDYLSRRAQLGDVTELADTTAGGMPDRVKCLHALAAHALAVGPGVNPFGDEVVAMLGPDDPDHPCVARGGERVAAIDCGTNSLRLLVADVIDGALHDVTREMEIVRLGQGVDRTGAFDPAALQRTFTVVERYARTIEQLGAKKLRFVATSATRDAANRELFITGVRERLGVEPEVITGDEEARLSFAGALAGLPELTPPVLVVDIGGGSTEFVLGTDRPQLARSVDIGCVRLAERHFHHDPPWPSEVRAARDDIEAAIALVQGDVPLRKAATLVGLAGTVTTVTALALHLESYDETAIHASTIDAADVHRIAEELLYLPREQRAALGVMHPGRVDVIAAGALVWSAVVAHTGLARVMASEHDILDGIALSLSQ